MGVSTLTNSQQIVDVWTDNVEDTHTAQVNRRLQRTGGAIAPDLLLCPRGRILVLHDIMTDQVPLPPAEMVENKEEHQNAMCENAVLARFQNDWLLRKP